MGNDDVANSEALDTSEGSDSPVYKDADWKFVGDKGWASPPAPLDQPIDQAPQIGRQLSVGGMSIDPLGHVSSQSVNINTIANPQIGLRAAFTLKAGRDATDNTGHSFRLVEKIFSVSLQSTNIVPRPETTEPASKDGPGHTGWYVDIIDVEMYFDQDVEGLELVSSAPPTTSLTGTIESSVSRTLSGGFFGETVTGSLSQTWTSAFSYSLQDFGTVNNSTETKLVQRVMMQISKGGAYEKPEDLVGPWEMVGYLDSHHTLFELPPKAISHLDLGCQGLWVVPGETRVSVPFVIKITPRFVNIQFRQRLPSDPGTDTWLWAVETANPTFTWRLNVDFSSVGYSSK